MFVGDFATSKDYHEQSLAILRRHDDLRGVGNALSSLGSIAQQSGDLAAAQQLTIQALAVYREVGDRQLSASCIENLGVILSYQGQYDAADQLYEEALGLRRELSDRYGVAVSLSRIGANGFCRGDVSRAAQLQAQALDLHRELDDPRFIGDCLNEIAALLGAPVTQPVMVAGTVPPTRPRRPSAGIVTPQRLQLAAQLAAAAAALHRAIGYTPFPIDLHGYAANVAALRAALGGPAFDGAWTLGEAMSVDRAVTAALAAARELAATATPALQSPGSAAPSADTLDVGGLSERELDVVRLLAAGRTYRQIGDELSIGQKTVEKHVGNILGKLGLENRNQVAVWAQAHGLVPPAATRPAPDHGMP